MRTSKGLIAMAALVACTGPWEVENEVPVVPPAEYAVWFSEVEACMGAAGGAVDGRFEDIRWHAALDIYHGENGTKAWGLWTEPHKITIRRDKLGSHQVVKHEIIHDLLQSGLHDERFFGLCDDRGVRAAP